MTPDAFVDAARGWLGVPWRHLGRTRAGVDCIGLVLLSAAAAGLDLQDPAPYAREPQGAALLHGVLVHGARVTQARPGDVLVFGMGLYAGHIGIATLHRSFGAPAVLHAYAPHRKVVEQVMDAELESALKAIVRVTEG